MSGRNYGLNFWENEKDRIIKLYSEGKSTNDIAKVYGCSRSTILRYLNTWNIPIERNERYNGIYKTDIHYFSNIDNEEKAYWVGLLLADGHISKQGVLSLCMKDLDIIEKFKKSLKSEHPIKYDRYGYPSIWIGCKQYYEDLNNIGFHNRKSYEIDLDKILSHIPKELTHHFVRGLFDGDGSIRIYNYEYLKKPQYHFGFTGLKNVCEFIKNYLNIDRRLVKESDITYTCVTRDLNKIKEIYEKLYFDATIYMDRKYNTFKEIM